MPLSIKALALTGAIVCGGSYLLIGLLNLVFPAYGVAALELGASVYPGYAGPNGFAGVIVVTVYALLDGTIAGALIAWLYNLTGGQKQRPAAPTPPRM
jgi:hypothetical protein